jgi:hypothetical protein
MTPALSRVLLLPSYGFLLGLGLLVVCRLLTGGIATRGLLTATSSGAPGALRVHALITTFATAASYAAAIAHAPDVTRLPAVNPGLLALVGGTNLLLLGKLAISRLAARFGLNPSTNQTKGDPS